MPTATKPELVIFDCDGVLVDSEPLSMRVLAETMAGLGLELSEAECYRHFLGRSLSSLKATLRETFDRAITDHQLNAMRDRLYHVYRAELKPIAGITTVLETLGVPSCVASSSNPDRIRISLELTGLSHHFGPNVFSATMVEHGKPAPDLFLLAARRMGVAPERCIVVEDSPAGIEAARAASMHALAFVGGAHVGPARLRQTIEGMKPAAVFERMEDLPALIAQLAGG
jgi:HAD superfamily hydrolase (TIGR01509 family)